MLPFYFMILIVFGVVHENCAKQTYWSEVETSPLIYKTSDPLEEVKNAPRSKRVPVRYSQNSEDWKFAVGLLLTKPDGNFKWCTGTIIDKNWILTAAQCLLNAEKASIYVGTTNRFDIETGGKLINVTKEAFFLHEHFDKDNYFNNDIGLIKVNEEMNGQIDIQPIRDNDYKAIYLAGWGSTVNEDWGFQSTLYNGKEMPISDEKCQSQLKSIVKMPINTNDLICTYSSTLVGVCSVDAGGPAIIYEGIKPKLVSISGSVVYTGDKCDNVFIKTFTRVSSHFDWICKTSNVCPK